MNPMYGSRKLDDEGPAVSWFIILVWKNTQQKPTWYMDSAGSHKHNLIKLHCYSTLHYIALHSDFLLKTVSDKIRTKLFVWLISWFAILCVLINIQLATLRLFVWIFVQIMDITMEQYYALPPLTSIASTNWWHLYTTVIQYLLWEAQP